MRWPLPWQKRSKSNGKQPQWKKARDLRVETLEDKVLLAVDTWVGGGSNNHWSNVANWPAGVAPSAGDQLVFQGTSLTATQNDLTAGTSFQSLEFQSSSFSIAGNSFTVTGSITTDSGVNGTAISAPVALSGAISVSVAAGNSLSLSGAVSGSGSLTTTASNTLSVAAANKLFRGNHNRRRPGIVCQRRPGLQRHRHARRDLDLAVVGEQHAGHMISGGTLVLTGSNTLSGAVSVGSNCTLQVGSGGTSGSLGSGGVSGSGTLAFDRSDSPTVRARLRPSVRKPCSTKLAMAQLGPRK
ncbi:MAG: hypothetical protein ACLQNE_30760 [Thermoguttaceae bacterium]